jgi:hypothetical protein
MRNAECGVKNRMVQSPFRIPHSAFHYSFPLRIPRSALRTPRSAFRAPRSAHGFFKRKNLPAPEAGNVTENPPGTGDGAVPTTVQLPVGVGALSNWNEA